ncbi:MAG: methylated-DNA--[protein]-cysteine S-methyltransferase [SAR324 cluster bacterium]|nr:methylated-DNA--[protein]-cysteine S-methyltransferase [SAR324 cluster bacterium]
MKNKTTLHIPEFFNSPLCIEETNGALTRIHLSPEDPSHRWPKTQISSSPILIEAAEQFLAYFKGKLRHFDLPYSLKGPAFYQSVWQELRAIPFGTTQSYGQVAAALGNPKAVRAVGTANRLNPLPILIPCHRVTKKGQNSARIYSLGGVTTQIKLLALENNGAI